MPAKLPVAIVKEFVLTKTDEDHGNTGDPTTVKIRQASTGEVEQRDEYFAVWEQRIEADGGVVNRQKLSIDTIRRREAFLTMMACSYGDEEGKPLFKFHNERPVSEASFNASWGILPLVVSREITEKVLEMNPQWGPQGNA